MRVPVELRRSVRLLNHGPTTLITASAGGRTNVMAAAWVMALDFNPPKIAAVVAEGTFTRELIDASGEFTVSLPTLALLDATYTVGECSGRDVDKFATYGLQTTPGSVVSAPLVEGCVGWLECRVLSEPGPQQRYDLFVAEVVAAWADDEVFVEGDWRFTRDEHRTVHHLSRGVFFTTGQRVQARRLP
ncbi:flavin reductase family protein [Hyalangium gracile]|uniref:flavin reductase family protein n=1 Tax=Hyalangium gracile TaxID=394092 RepID=UPI001CCC6693|nr:flavin reductase family protein [Hyalangium gracile]